MRLVQKLIRRHSVFTEYRLICVNECVDIFYPHIFIHMSIVFSGRGYDKESDPASLDKHFGSFPYLRKLRVIDKMRSAEYHAYLRSNTDRIKSVLQKLNPKVLKGIEVSVRKELVSAFITSKRIEHLEAVKKALYPEVVVKEVTVDEVPFYQYLTKCALYRFCSRYIA